MPVVEVQLAQLVLLDLPEVEESVTEVVLVLPAIAEVVVL
jgi:hypothetical protein